MNYPVRLENSPIEFVLTGPWGGRDRILLRSELAELDIIGLAAQADDVDRDSVGASNALSILFGREDQLNVVSSMPMIDIKPNVDSRKSKFRFAWKGFASRSGIRGVRTALNDSLPELQDALASGDMNEIEFALAPVIFHCTDASKSRLRFRRTMRLTIAIYILTSLGLVSVYVIIYLLDRYLGLVR